MVARAVEEALKEQDMAMLYVEGMAHAIGVRAITIGNLVATVTTAPDQVRPDMKYAIALSALVACGSETGI